MKIAPRHCASPFVRERCSWQRKEDPEAFVNGMADGGDKHRARGGNPQSQARSAETMGVVGGVEPCFCVSKTRRVKMIPKLLLRAKNVMVAAARRTTDATMTAHFTLNHQPAKKQKNGGDDKTETMPMTTTLVTAVTTTTKNEKLTCLDVNRP